METSPVNEPVSLGAFDGDEVEVDGAGEKVGAFDRGALVVSELGAMVSPSTMGDLVAPTASELGDLVSCAGSALGDLVSSVGDSTELGAFVPPPVDESTIVGDSVSPAVGALLSSSIVGTLVKLGDFVMTGVGGVSLLGDSVSKVVGAEVDIDEPSGDDVAGGEIFVSSMVELADGCNVGKVVMGAGVGDLVSDVSVGENVSSTAALIVGLAVTGRREGLAVCFVTGFSVGTRVSV
jgi:hypothetical protein